MCKQGMEENFELSELRTASEEATAHPRPQVRVTGAPFGSQWREISSGLGGFPQVPAKQTEEALF